MRVSAFACLAALLAAAACEPSGIAAPEKVAPDAGPAFTTYQMRGDGTDESPHFYVEPDAFTTSYSFEETVTLYEGEAAPCPPMYRGTLWMYINIANVGRRRFYFQPPFHWVRTIAPGYAVYSVVVPGVDERAEWTASGPVVAECRRGLLPGLGMIRLTDHLGQLRRNGINAGGGGGDGGGGGCGGSDPDYMTSITPADPEYGYLADDYDPYYPAACPGGGGGSGGSGSGGGGGGDWGGMTFPEMCSSLGGKLFYDYYCVELWNDKSGNYETVWCGTAAVCET